MKPRTIDVEERVRLEPSLRQPAMWFWSSYLIPLRLKFHLQNEDDKASVIIQVDIPNPKMKCFTFTFLNFSITHH